MTVGGQLAPRHGTEATWAAVIMTAVAAAVTVLFAVLQPPDDNLERVIVYAVPAALVLLCLSFALLPPKTRMFAIGVPPPLLGVLAIALLDIATHDSSAAAQIFFCYPVVYAAWQLRPLAAAAVTALAVAADCAVVLTLEPLDRSVTDLVSVTATLVAVALLLMRAGHRQDVLIARLRAQAAIDPLTGLVTRRVLDAALVTALEGDDGAEAGETGRLRRHGDGTALVIVDIDRFKGINDTYGHPVGDDVLTHIADIVAANTRIGAVLSRLGGDEIALLLPECSAAVAVRRAEQLVADVRARPWRLPDGSWVPLSVSVGVAHSPTDAGTVRELYTAADAALYVAKRGGRNRVAVPGATDMPRVGTPSPAG